MTNENNNEISFLEHYNEGREHSRLFSPEGKLEFIRSQDLISRYLKLPPATVLDVGGGSGVYSNWLLSLGHKVHLLDPVELHINQALEIFKNTANEGNYTATVGDARSLNFEDSSVDAVLLMGPLYHLTEHQDRIKVLKEALRVLKSGGVLFAVGISKFASALDGIFHNLLDDPEFMDIVDNDLKTGQHRNPNNRPHYFTTAFFHHPQQLKEEIIEAGFETEGIFSIEGPAWLLKDLKDFWKNPTREDYLLDILKKIEREESVLGVSAHIMGIARKNSLWI